LFDPRIVEHRGRIVKTTGHGLLVEFQSVVHAMRCAVEVQREMIQRNGAMRPSDEVDETEIACRSKNDPVTGGGGRSHQGKMLVVGAVGARRTLPDKPPLALPIGRRLRRRTVHGVHDMQPREHQEMVERVDNGARTHAPTVHRPRAYRSIRHARRHRRDQLGRKQQSGARRPAADTALLDHRKIPPIRL
jgi:hypothetical protein